MAQETQYFCMYILNVEYLKTFGLFCSPVVRPEFRLKKVSAAFAHSVYNHESRLISHLNETDKKNTPIK